jgi:putative tricarboxylic transport membrane protein
MDVIANISQGFEVAITFKNLLWCFLGTLLGTLVGVLPGLGPMAAISILLPITYTLGDPITSIIFLSGIYYGTQYGGSTTSILLNIPGEIASTVTTIDGYQMTKKGRAGAALAIAAMSSFFAGTVATLLIGLLAKPLSTLALTFGPAEYSSLMLLGLIMSASLTNKSLLKSIGISLVGVLLGLVGTDVNTGMVRFAFGIPSLVDGVGFVIIAVGVFGLAEIMYNFIHEKKSKLSATPTLKELYPSKKEIRESIKPAVRGTFVGSLLGLLPGGGHILSSFVSYILEKKISNNPKEFGKGAVAGVAGPEAANNAGAQTSFIPMLSLGIPTTPIMALIISTLIINGIQPGPQLVSQNPMLFWGLIASMWIGNFFLLILNLPLIGIWTSLLRISWKILYPIIIMICFIGVYYVNNNYFDMLLLLLFAVFGYVLKVLDFEPAPLAMGFIVGAFFEEYTRRTLLISQGDWMIFIDRPISLALLLTACVAVIGQVLFKYLERKNFTSKTIHNK